MQVPILKFYPLKENNFFLTISRMHTPDVYQPIKNFYDKQFILETDVKGERN